MADNIITRVEQEGWDFPSISVDSAQNILILILAWGEVQLGCCHIEKHNIRYRYWKNMDNIEYIDICRSIKLGRYGLWMWMFFWNIYDNTIKNM